MEYLLFNLYALVAIIQLDQKFEGTYYSCGNRFEKYSKITLKPGGVFIYSAGVSGCQVEVRGRWRVEGNTLYLVNDKQFLNSPADINHLAVFYPDMSLIAWRISKNSIKPLHRVDSGCIVDGRKHIRRR